MVEKKVSRISVRVPHSWKRKFHERGIEISTVVRSALWVALNQSDPVLLAGSKIKSKQQAVSLFNALSALRVRTITPEFEPEMRQKVFKSAWFRSILIPKSSPQELMVLGEFLDQGEYAEEVLQEAYR
jgi:hypothetical protein